MASASVWSPFGGSSGARRAESSRSKANSSGKNLKKGDCHSTDSGSSPQDSVVLEGTISDADTTAPGEEDDDFSDWSDDEDDLNTDGNTNGNFLHAPADFG